MTNQFANQNMIERDMSLTEQEDFDKNVKPHIPAGMVAEEMYEVIDMEAEDWLDEANQRLVGWWIIPENYYEELEKMLMEDELDVQYLDERDYGDEN